MIWTIYCTVRTSNVNLLTFNLNNYNVSEIINCKIDVIKTGIFIIWLSVNTIFSLFDNLKHIGYQTKCQLKNIISI